MTIRSAVLKLLHAEIPRRSGNQTSVVQLVASHINDSSVRAHYGPRCMSLNLNREINKKYAKFCNFSFRFILRNQCSSSGTNNILRLCRNMEDLVRTNKINESRGFQKESWQVIARCHLCHSTQSQSSHYSLDFYIHPIRTF
jgi:hypothetical protein